LQLLLADDHALVREGLKHTLANLETSVEFIEASTAAEVINILGRDQAVDLALLDLVMPGSDGFSLLAQVCNSYPDLPVVILSGAADPAKMRKAIDIGAAGFICKSATAKVMLSALRLVLAGGIYLPPDMLNKTTVPQTENPAPMVRPEASKRISFAALTTRQREVLAGLVEGKSNKQIASELGLSDNTVKIHVAAILRTLGVDNRTQAAVAARELPFDSKRDG